MEMHSQWPCSLGVRPSPGKGSFLCILKHRDIDPHSSFALLSLSDLNPFRLLLSLRATKTHRLQGNNLPLHLKAWVYVWEGEFAEATQAFVGFMPFDVGSSTGSNPSRLNTAPQPSKLKAGNLSAEGVSETF